MDTMAAFAMGQANRDKDMMVFDWDKCATLIKERQPNVASAGLRSDWECTGGDIYKDGKIIPEDETYVYLSSTWAKPELKLDGEIMECWVYEKDLEEDWTWYFPQSAIDIIEN